VFKNENLWHRAKEDAELNPQMVVSVLKKLGFSGRYVNSSNGKVKVPEEVDAWIHRTANNHPQAMDAVNKNERMKQYLKGLVSFLKENPAILNKDMDVSKMGHIDPRPPIIQQYGIPQFREPFSRKGSFGYTAMMMRNMPRIVAPVLGINFGDKYIAASNVGFGSLMSGGNMGGGAYYPQSAGSVHPSEVVKFMNRKTNSKSNKLYCSDTYAHMMQNIKEELSAIGHNLNEKDSEKINDAIKNLSDLEAKLGVLHNALSKFIDVASAYGLRHKKFSNIKRDITIKQVVNTDTLEAYLNNNIEELQRVINNNAQLQANIGDNLMRQVIPQLYDTLSAKYEELDSELPQRN